MEVNAELCVSNWAAQLAVNQGVDGWEQVEGGEPGDREEGYAGRYAAVDTDGEVGVYLECQPLADGAWLALVLIAPAEDFEDAQEQVEEVLATLET